MPTPLLNFFAYNRYGDCIAYIEWRRESPSVAGEQKLVAGLIFSLQHVLKQMSSPTSPSYTFRAMRTSTYKLHYMETMTGYRFALLTDPTFPTRDGQALLEEMFREVFTEWVSKDPKYRHEEGCTVQTPKFKTAFNELLQQRQLL